MGRMGGRGAPVFVVAVLVVSGCTGNDDSAGDDAGGVYRCIFTHSTMIPRIARTITLRLPPVAVPATRG